MASVWLAGLVWANHFAPEYITSFLIMTMAATLLFDRFKPLIIFSSFSLVLGLILVLAVEAPQFEPAVFWALLFAMLVILFLRRGFQMRDRETLVEGHDKMKMIKETAFKNGYDAILVVSPEGLIIDFNAAFVKLWGLPNETIDSDDPDLSTEAAMAKVKDPAQLVQWIEYGHAHPEAETSDVLEFKDGRWVERFSRPLKLEDEIKGRLWFFHEVTDQKRREEELVRRNYELDSFVYRASHDLKAPLNSIMGLIHMVDNEDEVQEIRKFVKMMDKSAGQLSEFIEELVHFSQDARLQVVHQPIDFEALHKETQQRLSHLQGMENLKLKQEFSLETPFYSDPVRLHIIYSNLLSNAIKYQDPQKPEQRLTIRVKCTAQRAFIEFEDNGMGIREEHKHRVFDLFFRASVQATGTGMGLYNTRNAVERLNGTLTCESTLGQGTLFKLELPNFPDAVKPTPEKWVKNPQLM